jgi:hypothetical protein
VVYDLTYLLEKELDLQQFFTESIDNLAKQPGFNYEELFDLIRGQSLSIGKNEMAAFLGPKLNLNAIFRRFHAADNIIDKRQFYERIVPDWLKRKLERKDGDDTMVRKSQALSKLDFNASKKKVKRTPSE